MWHAALSLRVISLNAPRSAIPIIASTLAAAGLWLEYPCDPTETSQVSQTWDVGHHVIGEFGGDAWLTLTLEKDEISISQVFKRAALKRHRSRLLDSWLSALTELRVQLGTNSAFGPCMNIAALVDFPRRRPPRYHLTFADNSVTDVVSISFMKEHDPVLLREIEKAPANLRYQGDLLILRWVDSLAWDDTRLGAALAAREVWLAQLGLPILPGWNAAGDQEVEMFSLQPRDDVTFYNPRESLGMKAVYVDDVGAGADDVLEQLRSWVAAHALPDGTPLASAATIAPDRRRALLLRERALNLGIEGAYYVDEDRKLWNLFPAGDWIA